MWELLYIHEWMFSLRVIFQRKGKIGETTNHFSLSMCKNLDDGSVNNFHLLEDSNLMSLFQVGKGKNITNM